MIIKSLVELPHSHLEWQKVFGESMPGHPSQFQLFPFSHNHGMEECTVS